MGKWLNWLIWLPTGVLIGHLWISSVEQQQHNTKVLEQLQTFKSVGPRFTAQDGDNLCGSVQEVQRHVGLPVRDCTFGASE